PKSPEPEWIELYNRTNEPINLKNWKVGDSQTLKTINVDFVINPADFIIITSKDTLPSIYPWLDRNKILILSLPAFNNDEDAVRILDQYGNLIDSVYYFSIFGGTGGFSLERVSPDQPSNSISNWGTSKSPFRATPLLKNSLTPKDKDLTITNIYHSKPTLKSHPIELNIAVKNIGRFSLENFTVKLINHENGELIGEKLYTGSLNPADSIFITFHFTPTEVKPYILSANVFHHEDEDTFNNALQIKLEVSHPEGSILISEIMFAPVGDEPEWIEIYNASNDTINLKNWYVSDASTKATITRGDFLILPNEYIVLSKDSTILNFYDIDSKIITLSLPTLNNSDDAVAIYDQTGFKIDSLYYFRNWGKTGFSIERIDFTEPSVDSLNWSIPPDTIKATPGKENFSRRKNFDLRIRTIQVSNSIDYDKTLNAKITVQNWGLNQVNSFSIKVYNDINFDSTETENELISDQNYQIPLNKKDSVQLNLEISNLEPGENSLIFFIDFPNDEDLKNNRIIKSVNVGFPPTSVVINEIMFEPLSGYCEYIELFNRSEKPVNLKNWKFNDMRSQDGKANFINISSIDLTLNPSEYLVIASDSTFFKYISQGDSIDFKLVILNKNLNLNNDFDDVVITDLTGKIIDSVRYYSSWHSPMIIDKRGRA
ncbi:MAG: lamin tail domain-containing protein, partial [Candidatus Kryptonium sp.]